MGDDGHTASLFPGTAGLQLGGRVIANEVPQQHTWRMSFTFDEINAARARWLLVTGSAKAPVLAQVARGEGGYPAARVHSPVWYWTRRRRRSCRTKLSRLPARLLTRSPDILDRPAKPLA